MFAIVNPLVNALAASAAAPGSRDLWRFVTNVYLYLCVYWCGERQLRVVQSVVLDVVACACACACLLGSFVFSCVALWLPSALAAVAAGGGVARRIVRCKCWRTMFPQWWTCAGRRSRSSWLVRAWCL